MSFGQAFDDRVVQADVEDRVHHAGHGELGARADGDEQRVLRVAELLAGGLLDLGDVGADLVHQPGGQLLAGVVVVAAGLGGDGEARGDRERDERHVGEVGALAAEQVLHVGVAFGLAAAEEVDALDALARRGLLGGRGGLALGRLLGQGRDARFTLRCGGDTVILCHDAFRLREYVLILEGGKYRIRRFGVNLREDVAELPKHHNSRVRRPPIALYPALPLRCSDPPYRIGFVLRRRTQNVAPCGAMWRGERDRLGFRGGPS